MSVPSPDIVRQFLRYDPSTGHLFWRIATPDMFEPGTRTPEMKARMFNARYGGREAFTALNVCNLRLATPSENSKNMAISKANTSGMVGVRYQANRSRWTADIRLNGKLHFLGRFKCLGHAISARLDAERRLGFHKNHGRTV